MGVQVTFEAEIEQLSNVGGAFWSKAARPVVIGQTWNVFSTFLDKYQGHDSKVGANNASSHRLALAAPSSSLAVARHALLEKQPCAMIQQNVTNTLPVKL